MCVLSTGNMYFVIFILFTFCFSKRKTSGAKELWLLGVLCVSPHVQKATTHLEDPGCIHRRDVEVCGCVQQPRLFNFIYFGGKRSKQSVTNLNANPLLGACRVEC